MKYLRLFIIGLFIFFCACKKESTSHSSVIGRMDIADANMLVYGSVEISPYSGKDISDTLKLFKLTNANEMHEVTIYSTEDKELENEFVVDGIYSIDTVYFLLNAFHKKDALQKVESYLVNKKDGSAVALYETIKPAKYVAVKWIKGSENYGFPFSWNQTYYIPDGNKTFKLATEGQSIIQTSLNISSPVFAADSSGNLISGNELLMNGSDPLTLNELKQDEIVVSQPGNGFYLVTVNSDTVKVRKLDVQLSNYTISAFSQIPLNKGSIKYLGSAVFRKMHCSCLVFDKTILFIDEKGVRMFSFFNSSLETVTSFYYSDFSLFINGLNTLNKEVFIKYIPNTDPPAYTQIFAPDIYNYKFIQVSQDGGLSFYAKQNTGTKDIFGFRSVNQTVCSLENDFGIKVKQILTLK